MDCSPSMDWTFDDFFEDVGDTTNPFFQPTPMSMTGDPQSDAASATPAVENSNTSEVPATAAAVKFQVCSSCRRKKRKCSQERPTCSLCRSNNWTCEYRYIRKKPGPAKGSVGLRAPILEERAMMAQSSASCESGMAIVMNADTERKLIDLYFAHVQPNFPMFCRTSFLKDFAEKRIPDKLMNAFFAVSLGFLSQSEATSLFGSSCDNARQKFARLAKRQGYDQGSRSGGTHLDDVKSEVLLTLYEYTNFPGHTSWMMGGSMVRAALGMGLNQLDSGARINPLTEFELEEYRFVWWSVWKLDTSINALAASPFGIDNQIIGTAIISTSIANFEAGLSEKSSQQFLPTDAIRSWKSAQEIFAADTDDGTNMHLFAISHLRSVSLCRQRLHARSTPELGSQMMALRNTLSCLRLSLPSWYFESMRQSELETQEKHRLRLETLLLLYMAQVHAFLPFTNLSSQDLDNDLGNWHECVAFCENIASVIHHWSPEYFVKADPMLGGLIWFAWFILTIHTMSIFSESAAATPDVKIINALDLLILALKTFAKHWQLSRLFLEATKNFQIWAWLKMDFPEILNVLSLLRAPVDPQKQEPGSVDLWEIVVQREQMIAGPEMKALQLC